MPTKRQKQWGWSIGIAASLAGILAVSVKLSEAYVVVEPQTLVASRDGEREANAKAVVVIGQELKEHINKRRLIDCEARCIGIAECPAEFDGHGQPIPLPPNRRVDGKCP